MQAKPTTKEEIKELLLAQIRRSSDFPAMAGTITLISKFKSAESSSVSEFANIILKDYALTSRLLKVVNSVGYSQFGEVTTISRAIILLGFENVKNLALTLMLFEQFQKKNSNPELINTVVQAYYSGMLAQKIAGDTNFVDREEAFICSMLHSFGRIMVAFYMPSKLEEIKGYSTERQASEGSAVLAVMGMPFEEIGMIIAKEWNFPQKIVFSMRNLRSSEITKNPNENERLSSIATISNEITALLSANSDKKDKDEKIAKFLKSFREHYGALQDKIPAIVNASLQELTEFSTILKIDMNVMSFTQQLISWSQDIPMEQLAPGVTAPASDGPDFPTESLMTIESLLEEEKMDSPEVIFTRGIQDINHAIVSSFSINDTVRIVLETIYRGMQLSGEARVLFLIKDMKLPVMTIRFGFGSEIEELKTWFKIEIGNVNDIFNRAVLKQSDLVIKDISAPDLAKMLPEWYKKKVSSSVFVILLPIIINNKPLGIFYIEGEKGSFKNITSGLLNYLKTMRDQTVLAVRQKQGY